MALALKLKKLMGEAGAGLDDSNGGFANLYKVLKQLVTDVAFGRGQDVSAYQGTIATGILTAMVAPKAGVLKKFSTFVAVCGSAGATTVRVLKNGVAVAALDLTTDNADPDATAKTVDLGTAAVAVAAGDLLQLSVSAAPTGGTGLSATLVIEPDTNSLTVE